MAQILTLNARSNAVVFTEEEVRDVVDLLDEVRHGEAVALDPVDSEGKARARARVMKEMIKDFYDVDVRGHMIVDGEGDDAKYYPAISRRKVATTSNGEAKPKSNAKK